MNTTTTPTNPIAAGLGFASIEELIADIKANATPTPEPTVPATDTELGRRIVRYCINSMAWSVTIAAAWSCSSFVAAFVVAAIVGIVMFMLTLLLRIILGMTMDSETIASLGHAVRAPRAYLDGFVGRFAKKPAAV